MIMDYVSSKIETKSLLLVMGVVVATVFVIQSLELPFTNVLLSIFPAGKVPILGKSSSPNGDSSSHYATTENKTPVNSSNLINSSLLIEPKIESPHMGPDKNNDANSSNSSTFSIGTSGTGMISGDESPGSMHSSSVTLNNNSSGSSTHITGKGWMPAIPISEMNRLLLKSRVSSNSMLRPKWASMCDKELLWAKSQIENATVVNNDDELYPPLYRNISMFKRSYELMEQILKVYIYPEGKEPIFHQPTEPILKGIYASEGWFMKQMEGNKHFIVKDPKDAHLFYLPFSSRMLQLTLYVRNSHVRQNLADYLKRYVDMIAAKYPFWNRSGGADHFLVACHDWAPFETRHHMDNCIKALCNANVARDFKIGKDVTLPTTNVRKMENPLRDIGGKPPAERPTLAFFAGGIHGHLRPILLKYWENKDPDMKIFGPMPQGHNGTLNYIRYMKSSKYCICARGFDVNSPRVVEAIFFECVPVFISDNYVPPFFEVLDWEAFSVFVPEKDIPKLKDILLSIPEEKYLEMQLRVKKVQKHFLWHRKPVKEERTIKGWVYKKTEANHKGEKITRRD